MVELALGLLLFFLPHLMVGQAPMVRLRQRLGAKGYRGVFSLVVLLGLVLIVVGMGRVDDVRLYQPPAWSQHLAPLLMLLACYLLLLSQLGGAISRQTAHPMSLAVLLWALAHLGANGGLSGTLLFATFALYSLLAIWRQYLRGVRPRLRPGRLGRHHEIWLALFTLALFLSLLLLHPHLFGGRSLV
ncbi:NnrU family protein [Ferrimonas gelatinilytica]|uniref:NnrU domain-containing protein n=1 Tax=Ferrimonas gelatinilytica TaxID=1255257 RepID=A0ABP9S7Z8_9GAMM